MGKQRSFPGSFKNPTRVPDVYRGIRDGHENDARRTLHVRRERSLYFRRVPDRSSNRFVGHSNRPRTILPSDYYTVSGIRPRSERSRGFNNVRFRLKIRSDVLTPYITTHRTSRRWCPSYARRSFAIGLLMIGRYRTTVVADHRGYYTKSTRISGRADMVRHFSRSPIANAVYKPDDE